MANGNLIWQNMSTFWDLMDPTYKAYLEQTWDGIKEGIDDAYAQMYEIDSAKSLKSCPVNTTRRWLMLDLSSDNMDRLATAGLASIQQNKTTITSKVNADDTIYNKTRSVLHKHYVFKYSTVNGMSIPMPFPIDFTNLEIYKDQHLQQALVNYNVINNEIIFVAPGLYYIYIAIDHTPKVSTTFYIEKYITTSSVNGLISLGAAISGDVTQFLIISNGLLLNPSQYRIVNSSTIDVGISGNFEVMWFEEEATNSFSERHDHRRYEVVYNRDGQGSGGIQVINFGSKITQLTNTGKIVKVFVNGALRDSSDYSINQSTITFASVLTYVPGIVLTVAIEWIDITPTAEYRNHLHYAYQATNFQQLAAASTFDDGGSLDDGGVFDTEEEIPTLTFPFQIRTPENVILWSNGVRLFNTIDYVISNTGIVFKIPVFGKNIKLYYFETSRVYVYGYTNILYPNSAFSKTNLGIFYDESAEYKTKDLSADNDSLSFATTTSLMFDNISLVSIPTIVDRVTDWNNIYLEQLASPNDYEISDGVLMSDVELPIQCWCPVVYFDEKLLANNFGYLVDYISDSSIKYKADLSNFFRALWTGPTIQNIEWAVSIFLGMPFVQTSRTVERIDSLLLSKTIKTESESFSETDTQLVPGESVVAGQYVQSSIHTQGVCDENFVLNGSLLTYPGIGSRTVAGDTILVTDNQIFTVLSIVDENSININEVKSRPVGLVAFGAEPLTTTSPLSFCQVSGFTHDISNANTGMIFKTVAEYDIVYHNALGLVFNDTVTLGPTWSIYTGENFYVFNTLGSDIFKNNGTVISIDDSVGTLITFDDGSTSLIQAGISTYLVPGDSVEPYQPLALVCSVTDYKVDNEWWKNRVETYKTPFSTGTYYLERPLHPYETTIYLNTTENLADSGVVHIKGLNADGFALTERIRYTGKSGNKLLNCIRGWRFENDLQFKGGFDAGTQVFIDLEYRHDALRYLAYQIFKDNTGDTEFTNIEQYFPLFATNVTILKIQNVVELDMQGLGLITSFMNRVMPSSSKWFVDIDTSYEENVVFTPDETVVIDHLYTDSYTDIINYGKVVSKLTVMNPSGFIAGGYIYNTPSFTSIADIVTIQGSDIFISYTDGTISVGDNVSSGSNLTTVTVSDTKNIMLFSSISVGF